MGKTYRREKDPWRKRGDERERDDRETRKEKDRAAKQRELRRHRRDHEND